MKLGDRVRIVAARDIEGAIVEYREFLDGSVRWIVEYWHDAQKREASCMSHELELIGRALSTPEHTILQRRAQIMREAQEPGWEIQEASG